MTTRPGDSAFPIFDQHSVVAPGEGGLTKREYFAAMALQGILAAHANSRELPMPGLLGILAVSTADALIEALAEGQADD